MIATTDTVAIKYIPWLPWHQLAHSVVTEKMSSAGSKKKKKKNTSLAEECILISPFWLFAVLLAAPISSPCSAFSYWLCLLHKLEVHPAVHPESWGKKKPRAGLCCAEHQCFYKGESFKGRTDANLKKEGAFGKRVRCFWTSLALCHSSAQQETNPGLPIAEPIGAPTNLSGGRRHPVSDHLQKTEAIFLYLLFWEGLRLASPREGSCIADTQWFCDILPVHAFPKAASSAGWRLPLLWEATSPISCLHTYSAPSCNIFLPLTS